MTDADDIFKSADIPNVPQCRFFVLRKKRLCRMTVRPGRQYCGEHEPMPVADSGQFDKRIPCPNDPKHTCYESKLDKHLAICNSRTDVLPPYLMININASATEDTHLRLPLRKIPTDMLITVIDKVNHLYNKHVKDNITTVTEHPIHSTILEEFNESGREETSLRHLRQASSILWLAEENGLVADRTCYVELGAGKGHLSYYACCAWCSKESQSSVLLVDRSTLRHKRENKVSERSVLRVRADLAHLALHMLEPVLKADSVVGFAKHLCGVASDYALRCITAEDILNKSKGVVLATCCHHRCECSGYVANKQLQDLGISMEDLNAMFGFVSWATCGDGISRERRNLLKTESILEETEAPEVTPSHHNTDLFQHTNHETHQNIDEDSELRTSSKDQISISGLKDQNISTVSKLNLTVEERKRIGYNAKALLDWGRILYLKDKGFDAKLCYYVPTRVSLENMCIVAKKKDIS